MGVQAECDDARPRGEFGFVGFKGRDQAIVHFAGGVFFHRVDYAVVDFEAVGEADHAALRGLHPDGQVVENPVAAIIYAVRFEDVERGVGLAEAGA